VDPGVYCASNHVDSKRLVDLLGRLEGGKPHAAESQRGCVPSRSPKAPVVHDLSSALASFFQHPVLQDRNFNMLPESALVAEPHFKRGSLGLSDTRKKVNPPPTEVGGIALVG